MAEQGEMRLPATQELIDTMLVGTTMWWEFVGESWVAYFVDCKDVSSHVFLLEGKRAFVKLYNRVLPYEEKQAIFQHEAHLFAPRENGKIVELKEWGLG